MIDQQLGAVNRKRGYDPDQEAEKRQGEQATAQQLGAQLLTNFEKGQDGPPQ
ncbi:MAG TPA: hypothetical protein VK066_20130 [Chloroflexota bacterium]|nr:hypothetical protein [Chloroflexota bacterium]